MKIMLKKLINCKLFTCRIILLTGTNKTHLFFINVTASSILYEYLLWKFSISFLYIPSHVTQWLIPLPNMCQEKNTYLYTALSWSRPVITATNFYFEGYNRKCDYPLLSSLILLTLLLLTVSARGQKNLIVTSPWINDVFSFNRMNITLLCRNYIQTIAL